MFIDKIVYIPYLNMLTFYLSEDINVDIHKIVIIYTTCDYITIMIVKTVLYKNELVKL